MQKLHSCLLRKVARGLQSMGLESGHFNEKNTGKWICILNVEEKKNFKAFSRLLVRKILLHIISVMVQIKI